MEKNRFKLICGHGTMDMKKAKKKGVKKVPTLNLTNTFRMID